LSQSGAKCAILQFWFRFEKTRIFTLHFYCGHRIKLRIGRYAGQQIVNDSGNRACSLFDDNLCCFGYLVGPAPFPGWKRCVSSLVYVDIPLIFADILGNNQSDPFGKEQTCYLGFFLNSSGCDRPFFRTFTWWPCGLSGSRNVLKQEHHCPILSGT